MFNDFNIDNFINNFSKNCTKVQKKVFQKNQVVNYNFYYFIKNKFFEIFLKYFCNIIVINDKILQQSMD